MSSNQDFISSITTQALEQILPQAQQKLTNNPNQFGFGHLTVETKQDPYVLADTEEDVLPIAEPEEDPTVKDEPDLETDGYRLVRMGNRMTLAKVADNTSSYQSIAPSISQNHSHMPWLSLLQP